MNSTLRLTIFLICYTLISGCNITSPGVYILQIDDLIGTWNGTNKVESSVQPGYYSNKPVKASVYDQDTSMYPGRDTFNFEVLEYVSENNQVLTHFGYITGIENLYEEYLTGTFHKTVSGGVSKMNITFTQIHEDSISIKFGTYEYRVSK